MACEPSVSTSREKTSWSFRPSDYFKGLDPEKLSKSRHENKTTPRNFPVIFGEKPAMRNGSSESLSALDRTKRFLNGHGHSSASEFADLARRQSEQRPQVKSPGSSSSGHHYQSSHLVSREYRPPVKSPVTNSMGHSNYSSHTNPMEYKSPLVNGVSHPERPSRLIPRDHDDNHSPDSTYKAQESRDTSTSCPREVITCSKRGAPSKHSHKSNGAHHSNESLFRGAEAQVDRVTVAKTPSNGFRIATDSMPWRKHSPDNTPTAKSPPRKNTHNVPPKRLSRDMPILTGVSPTQPTTNMFTISPLPSAHMSSPQNSTPSPHTSSPTSPHPFKQHPNISHRDLVDTAVKFTNPNTRALSTGIVYKVSRDRIATVRKDSSGKMIQISCSDLYIISPKPEDRVKVVVYNSKNLQGRTGRLLSVTGDSGVVRLSKYNGETERTLAQIKLRHLAKYVRRPEPLPSPDKPSSVITSTKPSTSQSTSKPVWGSAVLKGGTTFPFAPFAVPALLQQSSPPNYPVYNPIILSTAGSLTTPPTFVHSPQAPMFAPSSPTLDNGRHLSSNGPFKMFEPGLPRSFQMPPSSNKFKRLPVPEGFMLCKPVARGGNSERLQARVRSTGSVDDVPETIERLLKHQKNYRVQLEDDGNTDVKASSVRVSLVCPISQKRFKYPSRGDHCKHLQCFDAEAYIMTNINHKTKARVKQAHGHSVVQPLSSKKWHCPICLKSLPENQLYIDRSLYKVVNEHPESVMEVVQTERGGWTPFQKEEIHEVIDLTLDD